MFSRLFVKGRFAAMPAFDRPHVGHTRNGFQNHFKAPPSKFFWPACCAPVTFHSLMSYDGYINYVKFNREGKCELLLTCFKKLNCFLWFYYYIFFTL